MKSLLQRIEDGSFEDNFKIKAWIFDTNINTATLKLNSILGNKYEIYNHFDMCLSIVFKNISQQKDIKLIKNLKDEFGQNIIFYDNPNSYIIEKLSKNKQKITFAESCTGGLCAANFTKSSGASSVFDGSIVSYSNEIKNKILKVDENTLKKYGSVSKETVLQMLFGVSKLFNSNYAIAISGIAGPNGGSIDKPVGTVYIGITNSKAQDIYSIFLNGDRLAIQEKSSLFAITKMARLINQDIQNENLMDF
jgi:nicotinamide-nucleotide amidase